jgi:hypothetical protein
MHNSEIFSGGSGEAGANKGEATKKYEERGEKVLSAAERKALLKEKEELLARRAEIDAELAALDSDEQKEPESPEQPEGTTSPEGVSDPEGTTGPEGGVTDPEGTPEPEGGTTDPEPTPETEGGAKDPEGTTGTTEPEGGTSTPQGGESNSTPEGQHRAKIEYVKKRAKNNSGIRSVAIGAATIALAGSLGVAIGTDGFNVTQNQTPQGSSNPTAIVQAAQPEKAPSPDGTTSPDGAILPDGTIIPGSTTANEQDASATENEEKEKGIKDGYGERGMWLSQNKEHDYDYGDAKEVGEVCDHDEVEMLKYTADNQVESLADYMAEFPEELCPEGFYGLNPREIEKKLESLTPDEYEKVKAQAMHALDEAYTRATVTQRDYHHYGMLLGDENGAVVHENMQLVDRGIGPGVEVVEFYWIDKDGKEIGSMLVNIRRTSANEKGEVDEYEGGLEVLRVGTTDQGPETPPTPPTPPTPETPEPKNPEEEIEHAGPRVDQQGLDEEKTPATKLEDDQAGFEGMDQQKRDDEAEAAEAARVAAEQAEKQRRAEEEAAARRAAEQAEAEEAARQADEAARKAAEEASRQQSEAAEAERAAAEDAAKREEAQRAADEAAQGAADEAGGNAGASAGERAGLDY